MSLKNVVDGFSCILDFPNFPGEDPRTPLIKGIHQLNPQNLSSTADRGKKKKKKKPESPSPIKTIFKKFICSLYRNWKRKRALGQDLFFVWYVIGLFEPFIDKVCDSCIVSSWALLIFLLCLSWPNSNFLCCVITQNAGSSHDLLFCD